MKKLSVLLLFILPFTFTSCLKDEVEPELIICPVEVPEFIGKWEQISFTDNQYDHEGGKINKATIEFKEGDEKAINIELLQPDEEGDEGNDTNKAYFAKGKYIAKVYNEDTQKVITTEDTYKLIGYYANTPLPSIEFHNEKESIRYFPKIEQNEKGIILTLTNQVTEGEEKDKVTIETILTFKKELQ